MYSISNTREQDVELVVLTHIGSDTQIAVAPACGASLYHFKVKTAEGMLNCIDNFGSKEVFETSFEATGFKGAKLAPFVCRLRHGQYHYGKKDYHIKHFYLGEHAIHGLVYDAPFEITAQQTDDDMAMVEMMHYYRGADAGYPFSFDCKVRYELNAQNSVVITTTITNTDAGIIPVADGWHPYFTFSKPIDECQLEFQSKEMLEFDAQLIPTGNLKPYQEFGSLEKIGSQFFDNCFTVNFAECQPMLVFRDPVRRLQVEVRPAASYPYLQIYTPPHRQSIAIENLSAAPDAFNNGMGLISLSPGEEKTFSTTYTFRQL
ncbi:MAG: aldose 1-epimerase [Chitinophagaceae bacterium]|nr:MAG: aldose 1-epimerase [Chitinophagaceae bacterium]